MSNFDRRSFLKIAGVASLAYALAPGELVPPPTPDAQLSALQRMLYGLTAAFVDTKLNRVTPHFAIPNDWWVIEGREARLKGAISCDYFPLTCMLAGLGLFKGETLMIWGSELGGFPIELADSISVSEISLNLEATT